MKRLRKQIYCCLQTKLLDKIPDPRNGKEHYQSFIRKKKTTQHNISKTTRNTYRPKTFENPNIADIKSIITEHPKTPNKLSKTIKRAEKEGSNSSLYSDTKKSHFFNKVM